MHLLHLFHIEVLNEWTEAYLYFTRMVRTKSIELNLCRCDVVIITEVNVFLEYYVRVKQKKIVMSKIVDEVLY